MNELNYRTDSGGTVTCVPYLAGVAQAPIDLTEIGTTGRYIGNMTGAAGIYQLDFLLNGVADGVGEIRWSGTAEILFPAPAEIRTELAIELALIDASVSSRLAAADYTAPDNAGIAAIPTTPLLAADYVAPDNAGIVAIQAKTDNIPMQPAVIGEYTSVIAAIPTTPLLASNYVSPDNAAIAAIQAKTDVLVNTDLTGIPASVLAAAQVTPIYSDTRKINNTVVTGTGTDLDPWGPA